MSLVMSEVLWDIYVLDVITWFGILPVTLSEWMSAIVAVLVVVVEAVAVEAVVVVVLDVLSTPSWQRH